MVYYILKQNTLHRRVSASLHGAGRKRILFIMSDDKSPSTKAGASSCNVLNQGESTLAELPVGEIGIVVSMKPSLRGRKKFADVGIVPGTRLQMEAHAPFGGLLRIKVMESSLSIHRDDAANIIIRRQDRP